MPHFDGELPNEDDTPAGAYDAAADKSLDNALNIIEGLPKPPERPEKSPTEMAIDLLSANPPAWVTPDDIRKARRKARKDYRQELTDAIAYELRKSVNIDIKTIVESSIAQIVKKVTGKVEAQLATKGMGAGGLIDAEVKRLVQESFKANGVSTVSAHIQAQVQTYAKEVVANNILIQLKEGNW